MISTTIPIQGTFDIAKGRNSLRSHIVAQQWSPTFGARAAAALTALGELILHSNRNNLVIVRLNLIEEGAQMGVAFECSIQMAGDPQIVHEEIQRLERATDALDLQEFGNNLQITAHVYAE